MFRLLISKMNYTKLLIIVIKLNAPQLLLPSGDQSLLHICIHFKIQAKCIKFKHFRFCDNNILFDKKLVQIAG